MVKHILALEKDLFFSVKMRDTLRHYEMEVKTVRTLAAFDQGLATGADEKPSLVIVNIATQGVDWEAAIREARWATTTANGSSSAGSASSTAKSRSRSRQWSSLASIFPAITTSSRTVSTIRAFRRRWRRLNAGKTAG